MSPLEKRRGGPAPRSGSPSRVVRATNPPTSSTKQPSGPSATAPSIPPARPQALDVISPPPRAALSSSSSSSSPAPDGGPTQPPGNPSKETGGNTVRTAGGSSDEAAATAAAAAAESKSKSARIAHLERELSIMETEFCRELDRLSATESETATFWQARHGTVAAQLARAEAEVRLLRLDCEALRAGAAVAARELEARDVEIRGLRGQVRGLKEWVSTSTRSDGQARTSDEVFGEGMARLGNGLQNWVIVNFRRARLDLSKADESTRSELGRLVPAYEDLAMTFKVHLLQSIVSSILVELVFDAYFVGLPPEQAKQLADIEAFLSSFAPAAESVNQWRSLTLTIFKKGVSSADMQAETSRTTEAVISRVNALLGSITDAGRTDARDQGLRAQVTSAIELSRLLAIQNAVFEVLMPRILPHQRTLFDPATMEDIGGGGEDEDEGLDGEGGIVRRREICCVTFPGIIKTGDEHGGQPQYRNVISKARVLCSPE